MSPFANAHAFYASRACPRNSDFVRTAPANSKVFLRGLPGKQRQNECACSSPVSNLTRQNGGIFKIPIVCFRFAWISPNQNR